MSAVARVQRWLCTCICCRRDAAASPGGSHWAGCRHWRQAAGVLWLQEGDSGPAPPEGAGPVLARGLPQVLLLRLPARRGRLHPLCQGQPPPVSQGLSQVSPRLDTKTHIDYHCCCYCYNNNNYYNNYNNIYNNNILLSFIIVIIIIIILLLLLVPYRCSHRRGL